MVAQQPVPNVAKVAVTGFASGIPIVNVFHVERTAGGTGVWSDAALDAIANAVGSAFDSNIAPTLNTVYQPGNTTAIDLGNPVSHIASRVNTSIGIGSGAHVPQSMCACVSWKINRHYRGGHPRSYFGPISDSAIQNNTSLSAAFTTTIGTGAAALRTAINTASPDGYTVRMVAVHRWRDKALLVPPQVSPILTVAVDNRLDTQRRRLGPDR